MGSDDGFELREEQGQDGIVLSLLGDLDLAAAERLEERFDQLRQTHVPVLLDLSQLEFMDSTGIASIARAVRDARASGWKLTVSRQVRGQVQRLIELVDGESLLWPREG
jgi:anti-anti-sigma factor